MTILTKAIQAGVWAATWVLVVLVLSSPTLLPPVVGDGVSAAIDGVARVCLWAWGEDTDALDGKEEWSAPSNRLVESDLPPEIPADPLLMHV